MGKGIRNSLLFLKLTISSVIFYLIFLKTDLSRFTIIFRQIYIPLYIAGVFVLLISTLPSTMLLKTILESVNVKRSLKVMLQINFTAYFYSFLGEISGGVVRWYRISGSDKRRGEAIFAIVVHNILIASAAYAFLLVGFLQSGFSVLSKEEKNAFSIFVLALGLIILIVLLSLFSVRLAILLRVQTIKIFPKGRLVFLKKKIEDIFRVLESFHMNTGFLKSELSFSILHHLIGFSGIYLIIRSLGIRIPVTAIMWIFPLTLFAQKLPISIYGLGVREGMLIYFLGKYGIVKEESLLLGLLIFLYAIMQGVIGGIVEMKKTLYPMRSQ